MKKINFRAIVLKDSDKTFGWGEAEGNPVIFEQYILW